MSEIDIKSLGYLGSQLELIKDAFEKHGVEYMFIGKSAALAQGFLGTTQDVDVFPSKSLENRERIAAALRSLGFELEVELRGKKFDIEKQILEGRDFVKLFHPFILDIVFAPDGFESYEGAAKKYKIVRQGFPLLSIDGIIENKKHANREKDRRDIIALTEYKETRDGKHRY